MSTGKRTDPKLTTTSFAILTQLALRPWSAYELVQQRVRYFRYTWPLAESAIYRELKRLADMGLLEATKELTGRRARTIYTITDEGLDRLKEWMDAPVAPLALEFEAMIRLFAAPVSSDDQILTVLEQVHANALEMLDFASKVRREFLDGVNPLQDQAYVRSLVVDFRLNMFRLVADWSERAIEQVASWQGQPIEQRNQAALAAIAAMELPDPEDYDGTRPVVPPDLELSDR